MDQKSAYEALQHEICVELGFCGSVIDGKPSHVDFFVPDQGSVSADKFVEWVFLAEGMNPLEEVAIKNAARLRDAFVRHMGADVAEAGRLKWPS